jgi:serine/threonine protein kinase
MQDHRLALNPGFMLDNFRLESVLGRGGFGITYAAFDHLLGRRVAIKELLPDSIATRLDGRTVEALSSSLQENWEWAKERFLEEARALAAFSHPAIVGIQRLIEANGTVYIVMDYVEGESLEQFLRRTGPAKSQEEVMAWLNPIIAGLEMIHKANMLHRDIKPDNILVRADGKPVLIDFGSARSSVGATMTMTSIVTHGYSPIEQYQTKGRMGPWTDIYALGAVVCRAITGEKPPVAADRIVEEDFHWVSHRGLVGYSELFLRSVDWALRVKAQDRPQTLESWRMALRGSFLEPAPVEEKPVRHLENIASGKGLDEMVQISNAPSSSQKTDDHLDEYRYEDSKIYAEENATAPRSDSPLQDLAILIAIICIPFALIVLYNYLSH